MGKLWGDLCENQDKNWPRYNGTELYSYLCKLVMFHAYDQVAVHVYLYWTQDTIEGISFARDILVTVNTVSSLLSMFLCFEIEIWFLNLPQSMFQVVFRQGIFNLQ